MKKTCLKTLALCLITLTFSPSVLHAQSPDEAGLTPSEAQMMDEGVNDVNNVNDEASMPADPQNPEQAEAKPPASEIIASNEKKTFDPNDYNSIVFTYWEHAALKDAVNSIGTVRPVTQEELERDLASSADEMARPPPEEREVRLGGMLYRGSKDWVLWLNEERITPKAIPKEVMDLRVFKDYIELKWFDEYTNQIFPIRMRPHQRFNLDYQNFLPG